MLPDSGSEKQQKELKPETRFPQNGKILRLLRRNMPKGLKETSSQLVVSFDLSQANPNDTVSERIDLQLNALDNEVFVVTGVKLDVSPPDFQITSAAGGATRSRILASISKQDVSSSTLGFGLRNPSVIAAQDIVVQTFTQTGTSGNDITGVSTVMSDASDTPSQLEYLDIIATPDFFVNVTSSNLVDTQGVEGKLYGYRARADAATYAALVQSELLSQ